VRDRWQGRGGRLAAAVAALLGACGDDGEAATEAEADRVAAGTFTPRARPAEAGTDRAGAGPLAGEARLRGLQELAVLNACLAGEGASAATRTRVLGARFAGLGLTLDTYAQAMERLARDPDFHTAVEAGARQCAAARSAAGVGASSGPLAPASPAPGTSDASASGVSDAAPSGLTGTWTGAIRGELTGAMRLVVEAGVVESASLTVGDATGRLLGRLSGPRELSLGGRLPGGDAIRILLRLEGDLRRAEGTWDAVIDGRARRGQVTLTR
jgi:hypothetical protein